MRRLFLGTVGAFVALGIAAGGPASAADRNGKTLDPSTLRIIRPDTVTSAGMTSSLQEATAGEIHPTNRQPRALLPGGISGVAPGTNVYRNEVATISSYYAPCASQRIADDLQLAGGACSTVYYNLAVYGDGPAGTYNVDTALWNGNPCLPESAIIAGTEAQFTVPNDRSVYLLEAGPIDPALPIPATVWMAATFSNNSAGWVLAGQAEIGTTADFFSEQDSGARPTCSPTTPVCDSFHFTGTNPPWSGFWANINCEVTAPPNGACCDGTTCTQTTQAACVSPGVWQGAFTTCQPNACLTGACCTGPELETCEATNEPGCPSGLFRPGATCEPNACGSVFKVYENDFSTGVFVGISVDPDQKWGDDLTLGPGAPCNLVAYEVHFAGDTTGPATFDARMELWTNNDRGTPTLDNDDIPLIPIAGTARDFPGRAANGTRQQLLAGPFTGIQLPKKVWVVVDSSIANAGPIFAGLADVGFSIDGFAAFNFTGFPNVWTPELNFPPNGYDPTNCPGADCVPAGSFRADVWCEGSPPSGACCNDVAGLCSGPVLSTNCEGRWIEGATCDSDPFFPSCGTHACCHPNPLNPNSIVCQDLTPELCDALGGNSAPGLFCVDITSCPGPTCINRNGDCFASHANPSCEDAFCCGKVCAADPRCCSTTWDAQCVAKARQVCSTDHCDSALPITGTGTFPFNNSLATTDGPIHPECVNAGGDEQITKDLWFCWNSTCNGTTFVRTCGQTDVDTKIAVYDGCECPPSQEALLDCGDDRCDLQSTGVFPTVVARSYLIRLGSYPQQPGGSGTITISCGPPNQLNCPAATGDCCADAGTGGQACTNEACCDAVCGCDSFCCETEWDASCASTGFGGNGCGADALCPILCGSCPTGVVTFLDPPNPVTDARRPHTAQSTTPPLGIERLRVAAPAGADNVGCWRLCETAATSSPNGIAAIHNVGGGQYDVILARAITAGAVTKVTYLGTNTTIVLTSHPSNSNNDGLANGLDIVHLTDALNGFVALAFGLYSGDIDGSGMVTGADLLEAGGLLTGQGQYAVWNGTSKPTTNVNCP